MKKIYKYIKAFAVAAVVLLSFSCNNLLQDNAEISKQSQSECTVLKFNVTSIEEITENTVMAKSTGNTERTILPEVVELGDLTNFVVEGVDPWGSATNLGTYANLTALKNAEITLPYTKDGETWQFNLSAKKGGSNFYAHVEGIELSLKNEENPDVEVNFVLSFKDCEEGNGNFAFTIDYSEDASAGAVTKAEAVFEDRNNGEEIPELAQSFSGAQLADKKFTLVGENLPNGSYRAKITLYAGEKVASYWQDIIIIYSDLTSSKTQDIKLNKFVKFTYVLNDEGDESLVFEDEEYVKKSSKAKLPSPKRDTKVFGGWYTDEELETPFNFSTVTEATATVYAKWLEKNVTTTLTDASSTIAALDYGTAEDPVVVTVSGVYDEDEFTAMTSSVKANKNAYISLDISGVTGLTDIPSQWLHECKTIVGVTLPNTITTIEDGAFQCCEVLKSINLPSSLEEIGYASFQCCNSLTSINIPASVTTIEEYAFDSCVSLESITFAENSSITVLEDYVFASCPITSIEIPKTVITLKSAFIYCDKLETVTFESGSKLQVIKGNSYDSQAFKGCAIKAITIPASVKNLEYAFGQHSVGNDYGYPSLETIVFENGSQLTTIGSMVFKNCPLKEISIPNGVVTIGSEAFSGCDNLEEITIPDSVTAFEGNSQFLRCQNLASVTLGTGITEIPLSAFQECAALESISIPDNVTTIEDDAFAYCTSLKTVHIGKGVTSIGSGVFTACPIEYLDVAEDASVQLDEYGILYNSDKTEMLAIVAPSMTKLSVPANVTTLPIGTLWTLSNLESIEVDSNNTAYASKDGVLFKKNEKELIMCPRAKSGTYEIPSSVLIIHADAFSECSKLTNITFANAENDLYKYGNYSDLPSVVQYGTKITDSSEYFYYLTNSSGYYFYSFTLSKLPEILNMKNVSVYSSESLDFEDNYTLAAFTGDQDLWFCFEAEAGQEYKINWINAWSKDYATFENIDNIQWVCGYLYIYDQDLNELCSADTSPSKTFTANGNTIYVNIRCLYYPAYDNCAFRVYKTNTTE